MQSSSSKLGERSSPRSSDMGAGELSRKYRCLILCCDSDVGLFLADVDDNDSMGCGAGRCDRLVSVPNFLRVSD